MKRQGKSITLEQEKLLVRGYAETQNSEKAAALAGVSHRQAKRYLIKNYILNRRKKTHKVEFNGRRYSKESHCQSDGGNYYRATQSPRTYIHRDAWEFYNGQSIPEGHDVHHKNGDTDDWSKENLEVILREDHDALHGRTHNKYRQVREASQPASQPASQDMMTSPFEEAFA